MRPLSARPSTARARSSCTDDLSRYVGKKAFDNGISEGLGRRRCLQDRVRFQGARANSCRSRTGLKFDFAPYALLIKPRSDGAWDVSGGFVARTGRSSSTARRVRKACSCRSRTASSSASTIPNWRLSPARRQFDGRHDDDVAGCHAAHGDERRCWHRHHERDQGRQMAASISTWSQTIADFVEAIKIDDPEQRAEIPADGQVAGIFGGRDGKGLRTKPFLDLLAFAVANEDEAKLKANQAELKSLLLTALPLWERIDGTYTLQGFQRRKPGRQFRRGKTRHRLRHATASPGTGRSATGSRRRG